MTFLDPQWIFAKLGMMAHFFNPRTWRDEFEDSLRYTARPPSPQLRKKKKKKEKEEKRKGKKKGEKLLGVSSSVIVS